MSLLCHDLAETAEPADFTAPGRLAFLVAYGLLKTYLHDIAVDLTTAGRRLTRSTPRSGGVRSRV
jgi:hypothetical protein